MQTGIGRVSFFIVSNCLKHVKEENDRILKHKCCFCNKDHQIDLKDLIINKKIQKLFESRNEYIKINAIDFGENNRLARDSCELLKEVQDDANFLMIR